MGIGWLAEEFQALGLSFAERARRCTEYIDAMRALWTMDEPSFDGETVRISRCHFNPKPVQPGGPPVLFGGESEPALRRVATQGNGWYGFNLDPEGVRTKLGRLEALLAAQGMPVTLLSRHGEHRQRAQALALRHGLAIEALDEPPPWEGPLPALARLMDHHPHQRLLLCPVDMPGLTAAALQELRAAADAAGGAIVVAHDGECLQPLLGAYPSGDTQRHQLATALANGERRLQRWLASQPHRTVPLASAALRNLNHQADWELFRNTQP